MNTTSRQFLWCCSTFDFTSLTDEAQREKVKEDCLRDQSVSWQTTEWSHPRFNNFVHCVVSTMNFVQIWEGITKATCILSHLILRHVQAQLRSIETCKTISFRIILLIHNITFNPSVTGNTCWCLTLTYTTDKIIQWVQNEQNEVFTHCAGLRTL